MSQSATLPRGTIAAASLTVTAVMVSLYKLWASERRRRLRRSLPKDLDTWRMPGPGNSHEAEEAVWKDLYDLFAREANITLWPHLEHALLRPPDDLFPLSSGFAYGTPDLKDPLGTLLHLQGFLYSNPLTRVGRTRDGHDIIIRVIVIGNEGHEHLKILRKIATEEHSLYSANHALPMFSEFQFEDIVFGFFPRVAGTLNDTYRFWAKNSVGDIVDMIMQMLEALAYIHDLKIAHRDAFRDNFIIQWQPESLLTMKIAASRPRVYLIDFEVAVEFPPDCPPEECVCIGVPIGGSFPQPEMYARPCPPELRSGKPYCPFKLDVWQLGRSLWDFSSTIPAIDEVFARMTDGDPVNRFSAREALDRLGSVVYSMAPESLLTEPKLIPRSTP